MTGRPMPASFDIGYLGTLPGFVVMAAADEAELVHMVSTQVAIDDGPSALRFPRGDGVGVALPEKRRAAGNRSRPDRPRGHQHRPVELWRPACRNA